MVFYLLAILFSSLLTLIHAGDFPAQTFEERDKIKKEIEAGIAPLIPAFNQKMHADVAAEIRASVNSLKNRLPLKHHHHNSIKFSKELMSVRSLLDDIILSKAINPVLYDPFSYAEKEEILNTISNEALFVFEKKALNIIPYYEEVKHGSSDFLGHTQMTSFKMKGEYNCVLKMEDELKNNKNISDMVNNYHRCRQKNVIAYMALSAMQNKLDKQKK